MLKENFEMEIFVSKKFSGKISGFVAIFHTLSGARFGGMPPQVTFFRAIATENINVKTRRRKS